MTQPSRRGRRQPALVPTEASPETQMMDKHIEETAEPDALPNEQASLSLLYPGAVITQSVTLGVDFGDRITNFIKYAATDFVQEDEDHEQAYQRLSTAVIEGVITLVDDTKNATESYNAHIQRVIDSQTSGR